MTQVSNNTLWTISLCRAAGYGLLAVTFLNLVDAFVPAYLTDPSWKFNTIGTLVERMPVALVGAVLVFYGGTDHRGYWEKFLIRVLSWSTLVVSILFFMLVPLVIKAAMEIDTQTTAQINAQYNQQITQLEQLKTQIDSASEQQMSNLAEVLKAQVPSLKSESSNELKQQLATEVDQARKSALETSKSSQSSRRLNLRKSVIKWGLNAIVSAFSFLYIWRITRWARYKAVKEKLVYPR